MRRVRIPFVLSAALAFASIGAAQTRPLRVVATTADLASIVRAVAGDVADVVSLAKPRQDAHFVTPDPELFRTLRDADLLFLVGLDYEIWIDRVLEGARNRKVYRGQPGFVEVWPGVTLKEVPQGKADRSLGDLHLFGNPHLLLDPINGKIAARNVHSALVRARPDAAEALGEGLAAFERRVDEALVGKELADALAKRGATLDDRLARSLRDSDDPAIAKTLGGWLARARPLRGAHFYAHHNTFRYLADRFGFETVGYLEDKPGVTPTQRQLSALIREARPRGVRAVLTTYYYPRSFADLVGREAGIQVLVLPTAPGAEDGVDDYLDTFERILDRLLEAVKT